MACRGSGQVISNLGGTASRVTCPWCAGAGVRVPGIDAQSSWLAERADADTEGADAGPASEAGAGMAPRAGSDPAAEPAS